MKTLLDLMNLDRALTPAERHQMFKPGVARKNGYYAPPGTGPAGETCGSYLHVVVRQFANRFYKCGRNRARWTGGKGTDVLFRSPACKGWESENGRYED
jgi:hypothetical protein